jgi:hypothetical protein
MERQVTIIVVTVTYWAWYFYDLTNVDDKFIVIILFMLMSFIKANGDLELYSLFLDSFFCTIILSFD